MPTMKKNTKTNDLEATAVEATAVEAPAVESPQVLDAWTMATAILVAMRKTQAQARKEYTERVEATGKTYGRGVTQAAHTLEAVQTALRNYEVDIRGIARANGLTVPE